MLKGSWKPRMEASRQIVWNLTLISLCQGDTITSRDLPESTCELIDQVDFHRMASQDPS